MTLLLWMRLPLNSTCQRQSSRHLDINRVLRTCDYSGVAGISRSSSSSSSSSSSNYFLSKKRKEVRHTPPLPLPPPQQRLCFLPTRSMTSTSTSTTTSTPNTSCDYYLFPPPPVSSLPVVGTSAKFPVRRVYCVGKNYADHVVEMGGNVKRNKPVFFTKPNVDGVVYAGHSHCDDISRGSSSSSSHSSTPIKYPPNTSNLHYEVELVVAIGKEVHNKNKTIPSNNNNDNDNDDNDNDNDATEVAALLDCVYGYAVGIDLTRRDLQDEAKSKQWSWDTAKYFDQSAPIGPITRRISSPSFEFEEQQLDEKTMTLTVNGTVRQSVLLKEMIWKVPEIISELSKNFQLKPGDVIMTGTPAGVGPVVVGDRIIGRIDGLVEYVDITLV